MKSGYRSLFLIVAGCAFGCGSDDGEGVQNCTVEGASVPPGATANCQALGNFLGGTATCRDDGSFDLSQCIDNGGGGGGTGQEFEACSGTGQSTCSEGLQCVLSTCLEPCTPDVTDCGPMEYCLPLNGDVPGVCDVQGEDGSFCFVDEGCSVEGSVCVPFTPDFGVCGQSCDGADINRGQGACRDGEACLPMPTPFVETQTSSGDDFVSCTTNSDCDQTQGYTCQPVDVGDVCARSFPVCGVPSDLSFDVSQAGPDDVCFTVFDGGGGNDWPATGLNQYCGIVGATGVPADTFCFDGVAGDTIDGLGLCIGFCEDPNGGPDDELDCGVGASCIRPTAAEALFFVIERAPALRDVNTCDASEEGTQGSCETGELCEGTGSGFECTVQVECDTQANEPDAPCDSVGGFTCNALGAGDRCSLPEKVCASD